MPRHWVPILAIDRRRVGICVSRVRRVERHDRVPDELRVDADRGAVSRAGRAWGTSGVEFGGVRGGAGRRVPDGASQRARVPDGGRRRSVGVRAGAAMEESEVLDRRRGVPRGVAAGRGGAVAADGRVWTAGGALGWDAGAAGLEGPGPLQRARRVFAASADSAGNSRAGAGGPCEPVRGDHGAVAGDRGALVAAARDGHAPDGGDCGGGAGAGAREGHAGSLDTVQADPDGGKGALPGDGDLDFPLRDRGAGGVGARTRPRKTLRKMFAPLAAAGLAGLGFFAWFARTGRISRTIRPG